MWTFMTMYDIDVLLKMEFVKVVSKMYAGCNGVKVVFLLNKNTDVRERSTVR